MRGRATGNQFAAVTSGTGSKIDYVIGAADRLLVVFDDQHGVAEVAQVFQCGQKAAIVAVMQANRGLVENVENSAQLGADLRCQSDTLPFATGEGRGGPAQRDVSQPDFVQELEAFGDLVHDASGNRLFPARQFDLARGLQRTRHREQGKIRDRHAIDLDGQTFRPKPVAMTYRTHRRRHVVEQIFAIGIGTRGFEILFQVTKNSQEAGLPAATRFTVEQKILDLVGKFFERCGEIELVGFRHQLQSMGQILRG